MSLLLRPLRSSCSRTRGCGALFLSCSFFNDNRSARGPFKKFGVAVVAVEPRQIVVPPPPLTRARLSCTRRGDGAASLRGHPNRGTWRRFHKSHTDNRAVASDGGTGGRQRDCTCTAATVLPFCFCVSKHTHTHMLLQVGHLVYFMPPTRCFSAPCAVGVVMGLSRTKADLAKVDPEDAEDGSHLDVPLSSIQLVPSHKVTETMIRRQNWLFSVRKQDGSSRPSQPVVSRNGPVHQCGAPLRAPKGGVGGRCQHKVAGPPTWRCQQHLCLGERKPRSRSRERARLHPPIDSVPYD